MTDVLNDLGATPLLRLFPNWSSSPKYSFLNSLKILEFEGTPQDFYEISPRKPQEFQAEILFATKQEEFDFLTFWKARKGMTEKFWFPVFPDLFTAQNDIIASDTLIDIDPVLINFDKERFFIMNLADEMTTGKVKAYETTETETTLTLNTAIGKDISLDEINSFGLLVLGRFDKDSVELQYENDQVSKVSLNIKEVMEYD